MWWRSSTKVSFALPTNQRQAYYYMSLSIWPPKITPSSWSKIEVVRRGWASSDSRRRDAWIPSRCLIKPMRMAIIGLTSRIAASQASISSSRPAATQAPVLTSQEAQAAALLSKTALFLQANLRGLMHFLVDRARQYAKQILDHSRQFTHQTLFPGRNYETFAKFLAQSYSTTYIGPVGVEI